VRVVIVVAERKISTSEDDVEKKKSNFDAL